MNEQIRSESNRIQPVMKLENISKSYRPKNKIIEVLSDVNVDFYSNNFYAIRGHSGSGKSTLINILGLIDNYDSGKYHLYGTKAIDYNDKKLSNLRMKNIGFIFQGIHLNPTLKAFENVIVPMLINKAIDPKERKKRAIGLLESVGLAERIDHYPKELSGGEQQRVAIARALANNPSIILADEPTGNLDEKNEKEIFSLLKELSKNGRCVIVVSHSDYVKEYADKVYKILDGKLVGDDK
ncbi:MAG: ABC transporter ATP-binding protein [Bacilli bacterium]|nr:ABC transporter ATP-binding protein [Bacilli bacterium]MDD4795034.1 ABC transporter ATP-binding protein [Bacilli bacterium]